MEALLDLFCARFPTNTPIRVASGSTLAARLLVCISSNCFPSMHWMMPARHMAGTTIYMSYFGTSLAKASSGGTKVDTALEQRCEVSFGRCQVARFAPEVPGKEAHHEHPLSVEAVERPPRLDMLRS